MFLKVVYLCANGHNNIYNIFSCIENHPVTVGVLTAVITSWFWLRNFIRQKRAEAFFGFYAQIMLQLKNLYIWLDEKELLDVSDPKNGNVYALMYNATTLIDGSSNFKVPNNVELCELEKLVSKLEDTLMNSDNNVYPKNVGNDKKLWYDSQAVLFSFCNFIKQDSMHHCTNITQYKSGENKDKYKHMVKCEELINAMEDIQSFIEEEDY